MGRKFSELSTEKPLAGSRDLDRMSTGRLVALMNGEDAGVARAVGRERARIARGVEIVAAALAGGGRLFLAGAGTSGRLCVLEAAECPPTFNTAPDHIQAFMAGGRRSVFRSREGAEDRAADGRRVGGKVKAGDVLVGVAASGVTPYVLAALKEARRRGARTILVTCNPPPREKIADVVIAPRTGPEVLTGSTRLKAGTATKMILNTLTTLSMVRWGKTYGHWMVDLQPRSAKLRARAVRLIARLGGVGEPRARRLLAASGGRAKTAVLMARRGLSRTAAERALQAAGGFLARALR